MSSSKIGTWLNNERFGYFLIIDSSWTEKLIFSWSGSDLQEFLNLDLKLKYFSIWKNIWFDFKFRNKIASRSNFSKKTRNKMGLSWNAWRWLKSEKRWEICKQSKSCVKHRTLKNVWKRSEIAEKMSSINMKPFKKSLRLQTNCQPLEYQWYQIIHSTGRFKERSKRSFNIIPSGKMVT